MIILEQDPTLRKVKLIQKEKLKNIKAEQKTIFNRIKTAYTVGIAMIRKEQAKELKGIHKRWTADEKELTDRLIEQVK